MHIEFVLYSMIVRVISICDTYCTQNGFVLRERGREEGRGGEGRGGEGRREGGREGARAN